MVKLNPSQLKAVETTEGPVMVIAGPGTGKTQTLTSRIAHILKTTDTPPDGILALTFTDAASREMRQRLAEIIGPSAYYVNISTFHSFCSNVIQAHPDVFPSLGGLEPLSDLERISIFRSIIDQNKFSSIRPHGAPYLYIQAITKAIADLKREGITPIDLNQLLTKQAPADKSEEKFLLRNQELVTVYRLYQETLLKLGRYDFEDMILYVVNAFKADSDFLLTYQQRFLYILADEYQDTNASQNQLLKLLAAYWKDQANIFVVGDDDQAIFRFQGASVENILSFYESYPKAKLVILSDNYRSIQPILDAARYLISNNKLSLVSRLPQVNKNLTSKVKYKDRKIQLGRFSSGSSEVFFVGKKIQDLIKDGIPPSEIAVIFRHNADGVEIADMLSRLSINYDLEGGADVLTDPTVERILLLMRAVVGVRNNQEGVDLFTLLNYPFIGADPLDVLKLSRFAADNKINLWEAIGRINLPTTNHLKLSQPEVIKKIYSLLAELQNDDAVGPFVLFFEKLINKTGLLDWCLRSADSIDRLNAINSLFAEIKRLNAIDHELRLQKFLETIDLMRDQKIAINKQDLDIRSDAVALLTAHRAKGREFTAVFMIKAIDGKWGNHTARELIKLPQGILINTDTAKKEKNEDERRLFYVAMTRAKQQLFITSALTYQTDWGRRETNETMFIYELPQNLVEKINVSKYEHGVKEILETLLTPAKEAIVSNDEKVFLTQAITNFKLSPTALNTYLTCPYKFKLNNLMRAPRAKSESMSFGTAIHKALERFFKDFKLKRRLPDVSILHQEFRRALEKEILTGVEAERLADRGASTLSGYMNEYKSDLTIPTDIERFFGYGFSKTILGSVPLGGKVDKIELIAGNREQKLQVRVVDYKTGQPKSRGAIEGKTATSSGDYKRQLVFYRLLAELDQTFTAEVIEAELDFVEADKNTGKYKKERFAISKPEVDELKKIIFQVWNDIVALKFPRTHDTQKHCPRCEWRFHCWPDGIPQKPTQLSLLK